MNKSINQTNVLIVCIWFTCRLGIRGLHLFKSWKGCCRMSSNYRILNWYRYKKKNISNTMGFPFLSPYLDLVGMVNFPEWCNFDIARSTILHGASSVITFSFWVQVSQFLLFTNWVLELLAQGMDSNHVKVLSCNCMIVHRIPFNLSKENMIQFSARTSQIPCCGFTLLQTKNMRSVCPYKIIFRRHFTCLI